MRRTRTCYEQRDNVAIHTLHPTRSMSGQRLRISHPGSGTVLADGPVGWGITPFEGNYYVRRKYLKTTGFRVNFLPGLCIYKFLYVWLDLALPDDAVVRNIGWLYWLPNPLLPFIWYRVGLPGMHPELTVEQYNVDARNELLP